MKKRRALLILIPLVSAPSGCASIMAGPSFIRMYDGPRRPTQDVAVLSHQKGRVRFLAVDGVSLRHRYRHHTHLVLELLPGPHRVRLGWLVRYPRRELSTRHERFGRFWAAVRRVRFVARPGRRYRVKIGGRIQITMRRGRRPRMRLVTWRPRIAEE